MELEGHARGLTVRLATAADASAIVDLVHLAYRGEPSRQGWTTEADLLEGQRTDEGAVVVMTESPASLVLLAFANDVLVGCCHLARYDAATAAFGLFAVRPDCQGAGRGRSLLEEAERTARGRFSAQVLRMTVIRQREDLLAWYARRGYVPTGETEPFPYGNEAFGTPLRDDLEFVVLEKPLT